MTERDIVREILETLFSKPGLSIRQMKNILDEAKTCLEDIVVKPSISLKDLFSVDKFNCPSVESNPKMSYHDLISLTLPKLR